MPVEIKDSIILAEPDSGYTGGGSLIEKSRSYWNRQIEIVVYCPFLVYNGVKWYVFVELTRF